MLRAGKKIKINQSVSSDRGIIMAPVIDLCGLILRADKDIPQTIKTFLNAHNVQAYRVRYQGKLCIRLRGTWALSASDIQKFIAANPVLVEQQKQNLESVPVIEKIAQEIKEDIKYQVEKNGVVMHYFQGKATPHNLTIRHAETDITLTAFRTPLREPALLFSHANINIEANNMQYQGGYLPATPSVACSNCGNPNCSGTTTASPDNAGIFKIIQAEQNITLNNQTTALHNTLLQAGNTVSFSGTSNNSMLHLHIDEQRVWLNNPHSGLTFKI